MLRVVVLAMIALVYITPAEARHKHRHHHRTVSDWSKPRAWCGWWMRLHLGVANPAGNLARWWARYGNAAPGPAIGTIVVWNHHVGIITGGSSGRWIVKSGNDGHAVRERMRSVARAIAFRYP